MNAIITGATKGIGRAIAIELAKTGYNIIACARNGAELNDLARELRNYNVDVLAIKTDCREMEVSHPANCERSILITHPIIIPTNPPTTLTTIDSARN